MSPTQGRSLPILILAGCVAIQLIIGSWAGLVVAVIVAIPAIYLLLRPRSPHFNVRLDDDGVLVKTLVERRVEYENLASWEARRPDYSDLRRGFENFAVQWGRLFGGRGELVNEDTPPDLVLRFKKRTWMWFILPPLAFPRKGWRLMIRDAEEASQEISRRVELVRGT